MIFEKGGWWKSSFGTKKFKTQAEAEAFDSENSPEPVELPETPDTKGWTPLEKLRGFKDELDEYEDNLDNCEECGCDPCECEWNSVEET